MATTTERSEMMEATPGTIPATLEPNSKTSLPHSHVLEREQRVVLRGINWAGYETISRLIGDQAGVRVAYDQRVLELTSPSIDHDGFKTRIGRLIEVLTMELDIPCDGLGSSTWKKALGEKGIEAECYYIANSVRVAGRFDIDLNVDPPPDLAIEVEISRNSLDRMGIYATLGIAEVWRFNCETLIVEVLQSDGTYLAGATSPSLPFLPLDRLVEWIHEADGVSQTTWIRRFRRWVLDEFGTRND